MVLLYLIAAVGSVACGFVVRRLTILTVIVCALVAIVSTALLLSGEARLEEPPTALDLPELQAVIDRQLAHQNAIDACVRSHYGDEAVDDLRNWISPEEQFCTSLVQSGRPSRFPADFAPAGDPRWLLPSIWQAALVLFATFGVLAAVPWAVLAMVRQNSTSGPKPLESVGSADAEELKALRARLEELEKKAAKK